MVRRLCPKCYRSFLYDGEPCPFHGSTTIGQWVAVKDSLNPTVQESPKESSASCGSKNPLLPNDVQLAKPDIYDRKRIVTDDQKSDSQSESSLPNTYLESSININTFGDDEEKSNTNLILPQKINDSTSDNHPEGKDVLKKVDLGQEPHRSVKSRRNLFKQRVPEKRLLEFGKENLAGSICNQSETSLPNTYLDSSNNVNTLGDSAEKSNRNPILLQKRNDFSSDNHSEGKDVLKKADLDQEPHSSVKSRRNLFKQKVPAKLLLECSKVNLAGSISYQSKHPVPNTYPESSIDVNNLVDSSEKSNRNPILPQKRHDCSSDNLYEENDMLQKADLDQEAGSSVKSQETSPNRKYLKNDF